MEGFRRRLELVLAVNGESISQLLSSGMAAPKQEMVVEHDWCLFTPEEDERLLELHRSLGNKWTRIAELMGTRTKNQVRVRIQSLELAAKNDAHRRRGMFPFQMADAHWFFPDPPEYEEFLALISPWA